MHKSARHDLLLIWTALILALPASPVLCDAGATGYQVPDPDLVTIIDAPKTPQVSLSPDRQWMILRARPSYPSIAELAERELGLAGLRIKPQINGPSRTWSNNGLEFVRISDLEKRPIDGLPENPRIENVRWSPDGAFVAFTNTVTGGIELWIVELATGEARRLTGPVISLTARVAPAWMSDGNSLIACLVPEDRGPEPEPPRVPLGPITQESLGKTAPARTYQDLLKNPHDERLFDYYLTGRLAQVDLEGGISPIGSNQIFWDVDPSPDGKLLLITTIHRPYSYLVPAGRFPVRIEVWDLEGNLVHQIVDRPLQEEIPIAYGSVETGPRSVSWRHDADATLCWAEALDGGDAGAEAELRDAIYLLPAPFESQPQLLLEIPSRFGGIRWGRDDLAILGAWWWKTRNQMAWRVQPGKPGTEAELLIDRSWEDRYNDPGEPVMFRNAAGRTVLLTAGNGSTLFMQGEGASPEGDRPFLDTFDLETKETERLFHSEEPYYEEAITILDPGGIEILTRRESVKEVPNYFTRDLVKGTLRQITEFQHPTPQLLDISKELIQYERADGLQLSATLYLPDGYDPATDGPLPMVMWAYPQSFKSADAAGQITDSPYRFDRVGWWSPLLWLTQGFAVLDDPKMPIIGEGDEEPNDTFIEQLVSSAQAAVDEVVRRGVADPNRIAIGGHSYGAFMTANLLAHSDLFAAGLARTGAYNRTLTPFGFQSEERPLWESAEVYFAMSPFMHAEKIQEPLLLVHGEADNNPGTFPMQSERFYSALKGLGATVRLVMLPHESHSYRARESILHLLWETQEWLDRYVRKTGS